MKLSTFCAIAFSLSPLTAGVRIQMEVTALPANTITTQEMLFDSSRMRINIDANTAVFFLTDGGRSRMVMLDKRRNEYREMDQQMVASMGKQMQGMMAQMEEQMKNMPPQQREMMERMMKGKMPPTGGPPRVKTVWAAKGRSTVNGFACTQHEGTRSAQKVAEVCAAPPSILRFSAAEMQLLEKMREFTAGLQEAITNMPMAASLSGNAFADAGFDGFPVQRISFRDGQPSEKQELKSATQATFTDADFSLGNATKVDMPTGPPRR